MSEPDDTPQTRMARLLLALRSQGVTDAKVLTAIETTPRELDKLLHDASRDAARRGAMPGTLARETS